MIKVNLLSPEKKDVAGRAEGAPAADEIRERKIEVGAAVAAAVITVGLIGFLYFSQSHRLDSRTRSLAERKARKTELENVLVTLEDLEKAKKQTVFMMDELSRILPDWVWLTKLSFAGGVLNLSGRARTNHLIANFIDNLQSTNHFTNITLNSTQRAVISGIEIFNFSLNCRYLRVEEKKDV
jgi:type IV pilus assembly protein PilN